jgi:EAL domain-containing protein (putative c-di-GMP-specific phosphodiesterase class I)
MSVNVSGRQVLRADPKLAEVVLDILVATGLDPHVLTLELTETVLMSDPVAAGSSLEQLAALGVNLSVDDFGTGYSSLSYLKRFPVATLKIDRSFVRDAPVDASDAAICRAVIALAESLSLQVIAEGVETESQRRFLLDAGCTRAQGFLFGRPLPATDISAVLRRTVDRAALRSSAGTSAEITH